MTRQDTDGLVSETMMKLNLIGEDFIESKTNPKEEISRPEGILTICIRNHAEELTERVKDRTK